MKVSINHLVSPTSYIAHYFPAVYAGVWDAWKHLPPDISKLMEYVSIEVGQTREDQAPDLVLIEIKLAGFHLILSTALKWNSSGKFMVEGLHQSPSEQEIRERVATQTRKTILATLEEYTKSMAGAAGKLSQLLK